MSGGARCGSDSILLGLENYGDWNGDRKAKRREKADETDRFGIYPTRSIFVCTEGGRLIWIFL